MLTVYLQRNNGDVLHLAYRHHGQHLNTHEKQVRLAHLYWPHTTRPEQAAAVDALLATVPLMDTLVLTRGNPQIGEEVRQVFAGLVVDAGTDGQVITLVARDDPDQKKLQEAVFRASVPAPAGLPATPGAWGRVAPLGQQGENGRPPGPPAARPAGQQPVGVRPGAFPPAPQEQ